MVDKWNSHEKKKALTEQNIQEVIQKFKKRCEVIRKEAAKGAINYYHPRDDVQVSENECKATFNKYEKKIKRQKNKETLLKALEKARKEMEVIYKQYRPDKPGSKKEVKYNQPDVSKNKTKYKKKKWVLDFNPGDLNPGEDKVSYSGADPEFVERHKRKPCNCTIT